MEKYYNSQEHCKMYLGQYFAQKGKKFWEDGIMKFLKDGER